jgi:hypothetical protein
VILSVLSTAVRAAEPIKVGSVAALSGQSAKSGEGITRVLSQICIFEAKCENRMSKNQ